MRNRFGIALTVLAAVASHAAAAKSVTDATVCETFDGMKAFASQWTIDVMGALTAGTLKAEVYDYITGRADALAQQLPAKPTAGDQVLYCQSLNALYAR